MHFSPCQLCQLNPNLCHGVEGLGLTGCASFDHQSCEEWEWTCLCNFDRLSERISEVGGFDCNLKTLRPTPSPIPRYIPTFYHRFGASKPLELEWIALPLHALFPKIRNGMPIAVAKTSEELRQVLGLTPQTKIIVTGPGPDQMLEDFWRHHRSGRLLELLVELEIQLFTVPNFSFFLNAPPLHHRYNRSRILRLAERASEAGLAPVLHLNALHEDEWRDWESLLRKHLEITSVCLEFQTGYRTHEVGDIAFERLVLLQENIGRSLSPILIGAGRYSALIGKYFKTATIIDAHPYIRTIKRKICRVTAEGGFTWNSKASEVGEPLNGRFDTNLKKYSRRIQERMDGIPARTQDSLAHMVRVQNAKLRPTCKQKWPHSLELFQFALAQRE